MFPRFALVGLLLTLAAENSLQECTNSIPGPLPSPYMFDDTIDGVVNGDTAMGFSVNEGWAIKDAQDCLSAGTVKGFEYMQYKAGEFSVDFYNPDSAGPVKSALIGSTDAAYEDRTKYQYTCVSDITDITVTDGMTYGVSLADKTATVAPWGRVYKFATPEKYPCGQHISDDTSHTLKKYDLQTGELADTEPLPTALDIDGRIAVRPIMDANFVYTCGCGADSDCQGNDCNMYCNVNKCECKAGWSYNAQSNLCVQEGTATGKEVSASSIATPGGDAAVLVDGDFSTCITTNAETRPWVSIDMGSSVGIHAVNIKTPRPLSKSIKISDDTNTEEFLPPGPWTTTGMKTTVEIAGPWPIQLSDSATATFVERNVNFMGGSFPLDIDVTNIRLIEYVGYIYQGGNCIKELDTLAVEGVPSTDNTGCAIFYFDGLSTDTSFVIRLLSKNQRLGHPDAKGVALTYEDSKAFQIYKAGTATAGTLSDLGGPFKLSPSTSMGGALCVTIPASGAVTLTDVCAGYDITFIIHPSVAAVSGGYGFTTKTGATEYDDIALDTTYPVEPCVEILSAGSDNQGAQLKAKTVSTLGLIAYEVDVTPALAQAAAALDAVARHTAEGISMFGIYVTDTQPTGTFDPAGATPCTTFDGYPRHGDTDNVFSCNTPVTGQYVVITTQTATDTVAFSLCDIQVHARNDPGFGAICETDADCLCGTENTADSMDQHYYCNLDKKLCECRMGYTYWAPSKRCINYNECLDDPNPCGTVSQGVLAAPVCQDLAGSYVCNCPKGSEYVDSATGCRDIDECSSPEKNVCDQTCSNTSPGYDCTCNAGYYVDATDGSNCIDIDECDADQRTTYSVVEFRCGVSVPTGTPAGKYSAPLCTNTVGSYECSCNPGYMFLGSAVTGATDVLYRCEDIDECLPANNNGGCEGTCTNANMVDDSAMYTCTCATGYKLNANNRNCDDVDECVDAALNQCVSPATCHNMQGTYECSCPAGYELDATKFTCVDIKECDTNNGGCEHNCEEEVGSYKCTCRDNYNLGQDKHSCEDIDECADDATHDCDETCINTDGGYKCECLTGYALATDRLKCINVNECLTNNAGCDGGCVDATPGYNCSCGEGYKLSPNKHSCLDVDECATDANKCDQICINTIGSFICMCDGDYRRTSDQQQCVLGRIARLDLCYDKTYIEDYATPSSPASRELANEIEDYFKDTVNTQSEVAREGAFEYQVSRFYECPVGKVGVDLIALPRDGVSDAQLALFAADVSDAIAAQPLKIAGVEVPLTSSPQFVMSDGTTSRKFGVDQPCDYYTQTDYCQNEGVCIIVAGLPECRCTSSYRGPRCLEPKSQVALTNTEIGLIGGFGGLLLLLLLLGLCLCVYMRLRSPRQPPPGEFYSEQPPSIMMANQPTYAYSPGIYGYK